MENLISETKPPTEMITLKPETAELIRLEMESIPEKYQKSFNSIHEGLGVLREEYLELEQEIFFGEKKAMKDAGYNAPILDKEWREDAKRITKEKHKQRIKEEAIQVAAMAARIIQELT